MSDFETIVWATDVGEAEGLFPTWKAKYVAAAMARRGYRDGRVCWSQHKLAAVTGLSVRSIWNALKELEDAGLIRRESRFIDNRRRADRIFMTLRAVTIRFEPDEDEDRIETELARRAGSASHEAPGMRHEVRGERPARDAARKNTPPVEAKASPVSAGPRRNTAPDDWEPSAAHQAKVSAFGWPDGMMQEQAERFKEWEFREAKTDFDRAFHRWLRTENDRLKGRGHAGSDPSPRRGPQSREDRIGSMHRGAMAAVDRLQRDG